jgi:hypothetical protein
MVALVARKRRASSLKGVARQQETLEDRKRESWSLGALKK